jgi:hypothetical protein
MRGVGEAKRSEIISSEVDHHNITGLLLLRSVRQIVRVWRKDGISIVPLVRFGDPTTINIDIEVLTVEAFTAEYIGGIDPGGPRELDHWSRFTPQPAVFHSEWEDLLCSRDPEP